MMNRHCAAKMSAARNKSATVLIGKFAWNGAMARAFTLAAVALRFDNITASSQMAGAPASTCWMARYSHAAVTTLPAAAVLGLKFRYVLPCAWVEIGLSRKSK